MTKQFVSHLNGRTDRHFAKILKLYSRHPNIHQKMEVEKFSESSTSF